MLIFNMHDTASKSGELFAQLYGGANKVVVDIGGKNVNGTLRNFFEGLGMKYICVDIEEDASVDIVVKNSVNTHLAQSSWIQMNDRNRANVRIQSRTLCISTNGENRGE